MALKSFVYCVFTGKKRQHSGNLESPPMAKRTKCYHTEEEDLTFELPSTGNNLSPSKDRLTPRHNENASIRCVRNKTVAIVDKMNEGKAIISFEASKSNSTPRKKNNVQMPTVIEHISSTASITKLDEHEASIKHTFGLKQQEPSISQSKLRTESDSFTTSKPHTESHISTLSKPHEKESGESIGVGLPKFVETSTKLLSEGVKDRKVISDSETAAAVRALKLSMGEDSRSTSQLWAPQLPEHHRFGTGSGVPASSEALFFNTRLGGSPVKNLPPKKRLSSCDFFPTLSSQGSNSCLSSTPGPLDFANVDFPSDGTNMVTEHGEEMSHTPQNKNVENSKSEETDSKVISNTSQSTSLLESQSMPNVSTPCALIQSSGPAPSSSSTIGTPFLDQSPVSFEFGLLFDHMLMVEMQEV